VDQQIAKGRAPIIAVDTSDQSDVLATGQSLKVGEVLKKRLPRPRREQLRSEGSMFATVRVMGAGNPGTRDQIRW
jgi:hypothetical protein